jgi:hypothetical protein
MVREPNGAHVSGHDSWSRLCTYHYIQRKKKVKSTLNLEIHIQKHKLQVLRK